MLFREQLWVLVLSFAVLAHLSPAAIAQPALHAPGMSLTEFDEKSALAYSQAAVGGQVANHQFTTSKSRSIDLASFAGKPLIISLIYTSCVHTCPVLTQYLLEAVEEAQDTFGEDAFSVLTIGFDSSNDSPSRMAYFARKQEVFEPNWVFASADEATVDALAADLGFIFTSAPHGFDHLAQTTILDSEGIVYSQVYGQDISLPSVMEPLKQLIFGRAADTTTLAGWISGVKLFCTIYDPKGDRYLFDYSFFVRIAMFVLSFFGILTFLIINWRKSSARSG